MCYGSIPQSVASLRQELVEKLTALDETDAPPPSISRQCSLDKPTQDLIKLIFDHDMFQSAMQSMEIGIHLR